MSIIIFSRPVRSGKTNELMRYMEKIPDTKNVAGILTPDINDCRKLFDISTKEYSEMECQDPSATTRQLITVGRFNFYADAFERANTILLQAAAKKDLLVIDEVGKLELEGRGYYRSIKAIFEKGEYIESSRILLLVVRDSLYHNVVSFFDIKDHSLIHNLNDISIMPRH